MKSCMTMKTARTLLTAILLLGATAPPVRDAKPPVVAGVDRASPKDAAETLENGRILIGELGCASCHKADASAGIVPKKAPLLGDAGDRLQADWLRAWLADPAAVKPGTTMPHVLSGKGESVEPLVHYLMSLRADKPLPAWSGSPSKAKDLFGTAGCMACHAPLGTDAVKDDRAVVPLGDLRAKYSGAAALAQFLMDPLKWRPSGRMPKMNLTQAEAASIATLIAGAGGPRDADAPTETVPGLFYEYYEGDWSKLPDFDALKPTATGRAETIGVKPIQREDHVGLRFSGYVEVPIDGPYTFHLHSDDGSRLSIGNAIVVNHDGIHGGSELAGSIHLRKGKHALRVEWFEASGGEELSVAFEGPGLGKRTIPADALTSEKSGKHIFRGTAPAARFQPDASKVAAGRKLFAELRCSSCHDVPKAEKAQEARPLATLKGGQASCPSAKFELSPPQAQAIDAALSAIDRPQTSTPAGRISRTMKTFSCNACHERGGRGGPEPGRDPFFQSTEPTVGDEGRLPPRLGDVGAKLKRSWLQAVLADGTKVRPYMLTRMPAFGTANVGHLVDDFEAADTPRAVIALPPDKGMAQHGRTLVGTKGLSCVSCHTFNGHKAQGIQAMDLIHMPSRLNRDWYDRYMVNPMGLRPGTRMPTFWPEGVAVKKDVLGADTAKQLEAIWQYLSEGTKAKNPTGIGPEPMLLIPRDEAVLYRNFIQGAGPRAIGVGYPERINLAFDAQQMRMALLWQGDFIDASKHWLDRGSGFQGPAGENVLQLPDGAPFAVLADPAALWPKPTGKEAGFEFEGYQLDAKRRPTFMYSFRELAVKDFPEAIAGGLKRTFTFEGKAPENLWYRALSGKAPEKQADGSYKAGSLILRFDLPAGATPVLRKDELLVPLKSGTLVQHYSW